DFGFRAVALHRTGFAGNRPPGRGPDQAFFLWRNRFVDKPAAGEIAAKRYERSRVSGASGASERLLHLTLLPVCFLSDPGGRTFFHMSLIASPASASPRSLVWRT